MNVEIGLLISIISVAFALYFGISTLKKDRTTNDRNDASQLTTVIVKLETISTGITEIKAKLNNVEVEIRDTRERLVIAEESLKAAHKRMDTCERFCKRFTQNTDQQ